MARPSLPKPASEILVVNQRHLTNQIDLTYINRKLALLHPLHETSALMRCQPTSRNAKLTHAMHV